MGVSQRYELLAYEKFYGNAIDMQHKRNESRRQQCRNRDAIDMMASKKTEPEECILQVGNKDYCPVTAEQLWEIYKDYVGRHNQRFGRHIMILDSVLHADETTPHIHERRMYMGQNAHGEVCPAMDSAFALMGIERPDMGKPKSRYNNRRQTYSAECRQMWIDACRGHGLDLETEPRVYADRHGLELTEYKVRQEQGKLDDIQAQLVAADAYLDETKRMCVKQSQRLDSLSDAVHAEEHRAKDIKASIERNTARNDRIKDSIKKSRQELDELQRHVAKAIMDFFLNFLLY